MKVATKAYTLPEILRLGRPYDAEGQEVIMSRQACENAADLLTERAMRKATWTTIDTFITALRKIVDTAAATSHSANYVIVHRQLIGEARDLLAKLDSSNDGGSEHGA